MNVCKSLSSNFAVSCIGGFLAVIIVIVLSPSSGVAGTYSIEFWSDDQISLKAAPVIQGFALPDINHADYRVLAQPSRYTGSFSIADSALGTPDGFISLTSPDFMSFNLTIEDVHFELPGDPLRLCGYSAVCQPENKRLGIRLDPNGKVQRFDIPATVTSNTDSIVDTDYDISKGIIPHPQLVLIDRDPKGGYWGYFALDDAGDWVVIPPGTAKDLGWIQIGAGPSGDDLITPLGRVYLKELVHTWDTFNWPRANPAGGLSWFMISPTSGGTAPVPEPSTIVLLGGGLLGMLGWQRQKSKRR